MIPLQIIVITDNIEGWLNFFNDYLSEYTCKRSYTYCRISSPLMSIYIQRNFNENMRGLYFDKAIIDKKISNDDDNRLAESLWHARRIEHTDKKFEKL